VYSTFWAIYMTSSQVKGNPQIDPLAMLMINVRMTLTGCQWVFIVPLLRTEVENGGSGLNELNVLPQAWGLSQ